MSVSLSWVWGIGTNLCLYFMQTLRDIRLVGIGCGWGYLFIPPNIKYLLER